MKFTCAANQVKDVKRSLKVLQGCYHFPSNGPDHWKNVLQKQLSGSSDVEFFVLPSSKFSFLPSLCYPVSSPGTGLCDCWGKLLRVVLNPTVSIGFI